MKYLLIILRYIRGYVTFKGEKGFIERFINLCARNNIYIWDIKREEKALTASISVDKFRKLRHVAKRSGVRISIIKKTGLIFQYRRYNKRLGLMIGVVIFILFHLIMSQFVWCIDVKGNDKLSREEITLKAEQHGLCVGTYKKTFDEIKTSRIIATDYDGKISWMSVNIKGSMAIIEIREDNKVITETESRKPCNLIADFDGVILSIETLRGDQMVTVGSGVKEGDLLISGITVNEDLSGSYFRAKGKITALHRTNVELNSSKTVDYQKLEKVKTYYHINIFGMEIPLGFTKTDKDEFLLEDIRHIQINGYKLPFVIKQYNVIKPVNKKDSEKGSHILSTDKFIHNIYEKHKNTTVINLDEKITLKNDQYKFTGQYTAIDFIGTEKEIISEN